MVPREGRGKISDAGPAHSGGPAAGTWAGTVAARVAGPAVGGSSPSHSRIPPDQFGWSWASMRIAVASIGSNVTRLNRSIFVPYVDAPGTGAQLPAGVR